MYLNLVEGMSPIHMMLSSIDLQHMQCVVVIDKLKHQLGYYCTLVYKYKFIISKHKLNL